MTIRVLIVDDQELVRTGFRLILQSQPDLEVVGEAADGAESLRQIVELEPDVVLMDIRMPRMDGVEALKQLSSMPRRPRVLVLTTFDLDEYVFGALQAGAAGFLLKDTPSARLIDAIRVVHAGDSLLSPSVTRRLIETFTARKDPVRSADHLLPQLTPREREVLVLIARGLSNADIMKALVISEATVKTHVGNVFLKLGLQNRVQAAVFAYEQGVVVPPGNPGHP
jgi:DNA-binding NarL/FixJ family response regulator